MVVATATLELLEHVVVRDQGSAYRVQLGKAVLECSDAYRETDDPHREHLGASIIGRECQREVWYTFRWATRKTHSGKMLRLFNRGHLEEARFVALLRASGLEVWQTTPEGKQFRIQDDTGHFGGSMDCVLRGIPEMPTVAVVGEFKTHGEKSFLKLQAEGVQSAKWEHYIQMQIYMGKMVLAHALYLAVNKNTDELYAEVVTFNPQAYERYLQRAYTIIQAATPPQRVNESPAWFGCKFCDHRSVCHKRTLPDRTCRSCAHSKPYPLGVWFCCLKGAFGHDKGVLNKEAQYAACEQYRVITGF